MKNYFTILCLLVVISSFAQKKQPPKQETQNEESIQFDVPVSTKSQEPELKSVILEKKEIQKSGIVKSVINQELDKVDLESEEDWPTLNNLTQICSLDPNKVYSVELSSVKDDLPKELFQCKNLRKLVLGGSAMFYPEELGDFPKLKILRISYNYQLLDLPKSLKKLKNLVELDLSGSEKLSDIPDIFQDMTKLKKLKISLSGNNGLFIPESISKLENLEELIINGKIEDSQLDRIGTLRKLKTLHLNSPISEIPASWSGLKSLEKLEIVFSNKSIIPDIFDYFINLKELTIRQDYNRASKIPNKFPNSIWKLTQLSKLSISNCYFDGIGNIAQPLTELKSVYIGSGELPELNSTIKNWVNVTNLNIESVGLKKISKELNELESLKYLVLSSNSLTEIPNIDKLTFLENLQISNNQLKSLPLGVGKLRSLEAIHAANNNIESLPEDVDVWFYLSTLSLTNNKIKELPKNIENWIALRTLELGKNELKSIPNQIGTIRKLETIDLSDNKITEIPKGLLMLSSLNSLNLSNNLITVLPEGIGRNSRLSNLKLSNNKIEKVPSDLGDLENLYSLDLSNNKIGVINFSLKKMKNLYTLNLAKNNIKSLVGVDFSSTKLSKKTYYSSESINLIGNPIEQISQEQAEWLKQRNYANSQEIYNILR